MKKQLVIAGVTFMVVGAFAARMIPSQTNLPRNQAVASPNQNVRVDGNQAVVVIGARTLTVGLGNEATTGQDDKLSVGRNRVVEVGQHDSETIGGNRQIRVAKSDTTTVDQSQTVTVARDKNEQVGRNLIIDAGDSITLKTGSASITMKKDGTITITGKDITIRGTGKINVKEGSGLIVKEPR
jgi:type VI secretion system secreted protein VgrG